MTEYSNAKNRHTQMFTRISQGMTRSSGYWLMPNVLKHGGYIALVEASFEMQNPAAEPEAL